jgi:hypothetical protein
MSEATTLTIICFLILMAIHMITEKVRVNRVREAVCQVLQELNQKEAYDPFTAVDLPLVDIRFLRLGYRDFRSNAVDILTRQHIVTTTGRGKLYLKLRSTDERLKRMSGTCAVAPWR